MTRIYVSHICVTDMRVTHIVSERVMLAHTSPRLTRFTPHVGEQGKYDDVGYWNKTREPGIDGMLF